MQVQTAACSSFTHLKHSAILKGLENTEHNSVSKPSSDTGQPNLLTLSFERQHRHGNSRGRKSCGMTYIKKQAIETCVCKPIKRAQNHTRKGGKKSREKILYLTDF